MRAAVGEERCEGRVGGEECGEDKHDMIASFNPSMRRALP
jgi:hypothetical protein